nr:RNA-directed DNA polymerase, eukaryota, reverse transcriptase zinc-binding domain protein [Tanacetum cinerariifolium]
MESIHLSFQRVVDAGLFTGINLNSSTTISYLFFADDAVFVEVIEIVKERLSKWKMKALSIGGIFTLLKSVLGSIPIFYMSIYKAAIRVIQELETIRRVASLYALNRALILKWAWRFITDQGSLWTRVIKAIHGENGKLDNDTHSRYNSSWLSIVKEIRVLKDQGVDFDEFIKLKIGDGKNTRFWTDRWCDLGIFKDLFPRIYALETNKAASLHDKLETPTLESSFRRKDRGGIELTQLNAAEAAASTINLVPQADRHCWILTSGGEFSVASLRQKIDHKRAPIASSKTRWVKYVPIKANILAWKIKNNAMATRFNISQRGIEIDSISCPICGTRAETVAHLFFSCDLANHMFKNIANWWNTPYPGFDTYDDWLT